MTFHFYLKDCAPDPTLKKRLKAFGKFGLFWILPVYITREDDGA